MEKVCFYIAPIGEEESEERKHSDLFLESIVAPAFEKALAAGRPVVIECMIPEEYIIKSEDVVRKQKGVSLNETHKRNLQRNCKGTSNHGSGECETTGPSIKDE